MSPMQPGFLSEGSPTRGVSDSILTIEKESDYKELVTPVFFFADAVVPILFHRNDRETTALCDTGASLNCLSSVFVSTFEPPVKLRSEDKRVKNASNEFMPLKGSCRLRFSIGPHEFEEKFYVFDEMAHHCILGMEFFKTRGAEINFNDNSISFRSPCSVHLQENTTVKPHGVCLVKGTIEDKRLPNGLSGQIEGDTRRSGIRVEPTVVAVANNVVPIMIRNNSDNEVVIRKGQRICTFQPVWEEQCNIGDCVTSVSEPVHHAKDKAQHLHQEFNLSLPEDLPSDDRNRLLNVLFQNKEAFIDSSGRIGYNDWVPHKIQIKQDAKPITKQPFRMSPEVRKELQKQIEQMLNQGIIEECDTTWCSPVVPIKKGESKSRKHLQNNGKTREIRFCIDLRHVNACSIPTQAHIANVHDILDAVGSCNPRYMTTLDMSSAYFQQALDPESRQYTGFVFNRKSYCFRVCPQGLNSSPFLFSKLMNRVLDKELEAGYTHCYLDDILIATPTFDEHLRALNNTLTAIKKANLKLNARKCKFARPEVEFLGYCLTRDGITLAAKHVEAIKTYPPPRTGRQVKTYLGLVNYFRNWIPDRGKLLAPLTALTKRDHKFQWTEQCRSAFDKINRILTSEPVLVYADFNKPFVLATDASVDAIGGVLCQRHGANGNLKAIAYTGRATTPQEKKWSVTDLEALALTHSVKKFHVYLQSQPFQVLTDHAALIPIFKGTRPLSPKLARYAMFLSDYRFEIKHEKGTVNSAADALSRRPYDHTYDEADEALQEAFADCHISCLWDSDEEEAEACAITRSMTSGEKETLTASTEGNDSKEHSATGTDINIPGNTPWMSRESFRKAQMSDEFCGDLLAYLERGTLPADRQREKRVLKREFDYCEQNGLLFQMWDPIPSTGTTKLRLVVPANLQELLVRHVHTAFLSSHLGVEKTIGLLRERFIFKGMYEKVRKIVRQCEVCLKVKPANRRITRPPGLYEMTEDVFQRVHIDHLGPLPVSRGGFRYICVVVDSCSGFIAAWATRDLTAEALAQQFYQKFVCVYGCPVKLVSDNASTFHSEVWKEVCKLLGVQIAYVSPYTASSNGKAESSVKSIMQLLRTMSIDHGTRWDMHLAPAVYSLNNSLHAGHNLTPFNIVYGRSGRIPIEVPLHEDEERPLFQIMTDMLETQRIALQTAIELQAARNRRLQAQRKQESGTAGIIGGTIVFWRKPNLNEGEGKFAVPNHGPYVVIKRTDNTATIKHLHTGKVHRLPVNLSQLFVAKDFQTPPESEDLNLCPLYSRDKEYRAHENTIDKD